MPVGIDTGAYGCEVMKKAYCCEVMKKLSILPELIFKFILSKLQFQNCVSDKLANWTCYVREIFKKWTISKEYRSKGDMYQFDIKTLKNYSGNGPHLGQNLVSNKRNSSNQWKNCCTALLLKTKLAFLCTFYRYKKL